MPPITRSQARANKGKNIATEELPLSHREVGESSQPSKRTAQRKQSLRPRQRRGRPNREAERKRELEEGSVHDLEGQITMAITEALQQAIREWTAHTAGIIQGLRPYLREVLAPLLSKDYPSSVEISPPSFKESESGKGGMRRGPARPRYRKKIPSMCKKCQKRHYGECLQGTNKCFKCGQTGHIAKECRNPEAAPIRCFACDQVGHIASNCPNRAQGATGRGRPAQPRLTTAAN